MDIKQLKSEFQLIDKTAANSLLDLGYEIGHSTGEGDQIAVIDGDVHLQGDLYLDFDNSYADLNLWFEDEERIEGLVILGDFSVDGSIINEEGDYGPFLIVKGSLNAQHGVFGGSVVRVLGDAEFSGVVLGHYNHGMLTVKGDFQTPLLISDDHAYELNFGSTPVWEHGISNFGFPLSAYLHDSIAIGVDEEDWETEVLYGYNPDTDEEIDLSEDLIQSIMSHKPILKAQQPIPGREAWIRAVRNRPSLMANVPTSHMDSDFYKDVVKEYGHALEHIPPAAITEELIELALKDTGYAIEYIPEKLLNTEHLKLALENKDLESIYRYLPESFKLKKPQLAQQLISEDGNSLDKVPQSLINEDLILLAIDTCIQNNDQPVTLLRVIPEEQFNEEMALKIAKSFPYWIMNLPKKHINAHLLFEVYIHNNSLPDSVLRKMDEDVMQQLSHLQKNHKTKNKTLFENSVISFYHSEEMKLIAQHEKPEAHSYVFEFDKMVVMLAVVPQKPKYSLHNFIKKNQKTQKWSQWGQKVGHFIHSRKWPKIENTHKPVEPFASGFSGFEYKSEQELIKDVLTLKKSIQYLSKDYALKQVIASFEYLTDREPMIAAERELILESLTIN